MSVSVCVCHLWCVNKFLLLLLSDIIEPRGDSGVCFNALGKAKADVACVWCNEKKSETKNNNCPNQYYGGK